jgi:hypothetical protein
MKTTVVTIFIMCVLLWTGCVDFPTSYSRIESDKPRLLDFIYEPPDAAPGDTVLLKAIFAGKTVTPDQCTWEMSTKMIINEYYIYNAEDTIPLKITPVDYSFSDRTSTVAFTFVVPENVIEESSIVPERWTDNLPEYYHSLIPESFRSLSKHSVCSMLSGNFSVESLPEEIDASLLPFLPALFQCFTTPIHIYCTLDKGHTIQSILNVRYNSRFSSIPELNVPVNRNPSIDSIGVYSVAEEELEQFDPENSDYSFTRQILDKDTNTVPIVTGRSYFLQAYTGNLDTTMSIDAAMGNGERLPEIHMTQWYITFDENEMKEVGPSDLASVSSGRLLCRFHPPQNKDIKTCTIWLEVRDQFINEFYRPFGSTLKELHIQFKYDEK